MGLDNATQHVADQLGRAVLVFDTELNVLAYSVHDGDVDRGRMSIILHRKATPLAVEMIARSKAKSSRDAVIVPPHEDVQARVLMPLRHKGQLYGYLSFSESANINESALRAYTDRLADASETLGALLALRELANEDDASGRGALMSDLLSATPEDRERAADGLLASRLLASADHYTAVVLRSAGTRAVDVSRVRLATEKALRDVVRSSAFQAFGTVTESQGMAVIPGDVDPDQIRQLLSREPGHIIAGVGGGREKLANINESFREAWLASETVMRLNEPGQVLADWADIPLDRVLVQLPLDELRMEDLPDGVVRLLGAQSGIDLIRTLDSYLRCGGEAQKTAQLLHIHRSTLYYRLDKIAQLTGHDLADGVVRRDLHTGLRVARLAGFWTP